MLELLVAFDGVRPANTTTSHRTGILALVQMDTELYLEWRDELAIDDQDVDCLVACIESTRGEELDSSSEGDSRRRRPFIIYSLQNSIAFSCVTSVVGDDTSGTLLVTMKDSLPRLFHCKCAPPTAIVQSLGALVNDVEVEPARNGVAFFKSVIVDGGNDRGHSPSDWRDNVLEGFSRVTTFYVNTAQKILDLGGLGRRTGGRYGSGSDEYIENPWIEKRHVVLPSSRFSNKPVDNGVLRRFIGPQGELLNYDNLRLLVHCGSISEPLRRTIWTYLLNIRSPEMTDEQFNDHCVYLRNKYSQLASTGLPDEESVARIEKDIVRTDRSIFHPNDSINNSVFLVMNQVLATYVASDPELDYVQGMNDFMSPIVYLFTSGSSIDRNSDESLVFWLFSELMSLTRENFKHCSESIEKQLEMLREMIWQVDPIYYDYFSLHHDSLQLYFCYRWLLVWFKREYGYLEVLKLWDTILSASNRSMYVLCVALAMLMEERSVLLKECKHFDEILCHLNERAGQWSLPRILERASQYELYFEKSRTHQRK